MSTKKYFAAAGCMVLLFLVINQRQVYAAWDHLLHMEFNDHQAKEDYQKKCKVEAGEKQRQQEEKERKEKEAQAKRDKEKREQEQRRREAEERKAQAEAREIARKQSEERMKKQEEECSKPFI